MDRGEGATEEVPMETGEGATGGGDPREHMIAHFHTQLTAAETRVEDLKAEVAERVRVLEGVQGQGPSVEALARETSHLDGKHVVFGKVIKGKGVIREIEHISTGDNDCPTIDIIIANCGEIPEGEDDGVVNFFKDGDIYLDWPCDLDVKHEELSWWISVVDSAKSFGNEHFKVV
ncbi:peptidyl-prolyl cis-trans isomerase CYP40-like [Cryptomeria japonica]|uniref:peptidyl-prolyl cis-trans isomerase CYP40-like n=1 Tax=Cryptomeria japonica TaxID=3369 RepID=UPI0027D9FD26|nr:peptidyl-prolyl cis-trans isomerase CYP40-like [Cryptomeria japonica]